MAPNLDKKRSLTPTKEIKLNQSNYVIIIAARLSDLYEIQAKVGEGTLLIRGVWECVSGSA
jgi:hypothetical protein